MSEGVSKYITKVCKDACVTEQRPVDVQYQYSLVNGMLVFAVKCPWKRVERRINYRLERNLRKNFNVIFCNVMEMNSPIDFVPGDIDPNFSFAEWELFGEWGTLRISEDPFLNPHLHISAKAGDQETKYQALERVGYAYNGYPCKTHSDWELFCEYYKKAFGDLPKGVGQTIRVTVKE